MSLTLPSASRRSGLRISTSTLIRLGALGEAASAGDLVIHRASKMMARKGKVMLVSDAEGLAEAGDEVWQAIRMPQVHDSLSPILYALPAQMLAYHTAVAKGTDVDQPRNLAKSVTVE